MSIAYYISGHGFGHAARQQPVIERLSQANIRVYVRSSAPAKFFDYPQVEIHSNAYDIGMIQPDSLHVDMAATLAWYADFLDKQDHLIEEEVQFIQDSHIRLIVSDMPPIAFEIAERATIPSLAITHFTWDWIYELAIKENPEYQFVYDSITASYHKATLALELPFAHSLPFPNIKTAPLIIPELTRTKGKLFAELNIPKNNKVALVSMGGFDWQPYHASRLGDFGGWVFLVTDGMWESVKYLSNCRLIPREFQHYHDLIAHVDVVVGKAGGTTISQCIAYGTPMIYTLRDGYRENELLHDALCKYAKSQFVEKAEFEEGAWLDWLDDILAHPDSWGEIQTNGAEVAVQTILQFLS